VRQIKRDKLGFLQRCAREYGDIVTLWLRNRPVFLINHPDLIAHVLLTRSQGYKKAFQLAAGEGVLGRGLLSSDGDDWRRQRRLTQPAFQRQRFPLYFEVVRACIQDHLGAWKEGQKLDIHKELEHLALNSVAACLFHTDLKDRGCDFSFGLRTNQQAVWFAKRGRPLLPFRALLQRHRRAAALKRFDDIVYGLIRERRAQEREPGDLLAALLCARDEENDRPLSDQQIRDACLTLLVTGSETIAIALCWTWYLLSRHAHAETRLADEVASVTGNQVPDYTALPRLQYTSMVLLESLRLYPPSYCLVREAMAEEALGGYVLAPGQKVWMSQWVLHRDPRYFDRADEFAPERWAGDLQDRLPRFAYFPFGGGPRTCIGDSMALMEGVLALALIAQRFRFSRMLTEPIRPDPGFALKPAPPTETLLCRRHNFP
jgi:cytochrome P450